ncbi:hypothetical protein GmHk_06G017892 [Glycine max]|nr:hypothetical protein GmHk_06G017892 [Glycine max]
MKGVLQFLSRQSIDYLTVAALWKKLEGSPFPSLKSQYNMYLLAFIGRDKDPNFYSKEATINDKDISPSTSRKLCLHHQPQRASCKVHFPLSDSNDPPYYEPVHNCGHYRMFKLHQC